MIYNKNTVPTDADIRIFAIPGLANTCDNPKSISLSAEVISLPENKKFSGFKSL